MTANGVSIPPERARAAETVAAVLAPGRRVALTTHVNADGDGVGSEVALWHLLTARGLRAAIANPTPIPERFHFLVPNGADHSDRAMREIESAEVVVVLDISDVSRLGDLARAITQSHAVACIDHHVSGGTLPRGPRLVAPEAAATAELVFDFASALQWSRSPCCSASSRMARSRSVSARSATWTSPSWRIGSAAGDTARRPGRRSMARSPRRRPRCSRRRGSISTGASVAQERPHEISFGEVPARPHAPGHIASRQAAGDRGVAPTTAMQVVDPLTQLDQEVELVAQPRRALLHATAVLAKQHLRLERQDPPQRIHHRVHVLVGAERTEAGAE